MTKTEQEIISLVVQRYEAMESKYKLRKEIAVIKRWVGDKVEKGDLENLNHHWITADDLEDGSPGETVNWYTTDKMEELYTDYHDCRDGITNILASLRYHCKKHIKEVSLITEKNKLEKELAQ